jgi:hypothetical protein
VRGQRIVIAGTGPLLLAAAHTAREAGAQVLRIAEQAPWSQLAGFGLQLPRWPAKAVQALPLLHPALRAASHVLEATGTQQVQSVRLQRGAGEEVLACDRLACGFGLVPHTHLGQMLGCELNDRLGLAVDAVQATAVPGVFAAGECTGFGGSERALVEGAMAGHAAVGDTTAALALAPQRARWQGFADALHHHFALRTPAAQPAPPRHPGLPLRRCAPRRPERTAQQLDRRQAAHALRHGRLPGPHLRRCHTIPFRLDARTRAPSAGPRARRHAGQTPAATTKAPHEHRPNSTDTWFASPARTARPRLPRAAAPWASQAPT